MNKVDPQVWCVVIQDYVHTIPVGARHEMKFRQSYCERYSDCVGVDFYR
ncbi:MAG: hypothetical protein ACI9Y8_000766 [Candidatus Omnitrophota bacterium]|jgi:hypothetical protein